MLILYPYILTVSVSLIILLTGVSTCRASAFHHQDLYSWKKSPSNEKYVEETGIGCNRMITLEERI